MGANQKESLGLFIVRLVVVAILFAVGGYFGSIGYDKMSKDTGSNSSLGDINHKMIKYPFELSSFPSSNESRISLIKKFDIDFTTEDIFTVSNPIFYNASAELNLPNSVQRIGIALTNPNTNLMWVNNYNVDLFIDHEKTLKNYIELHPISANKFIDYGQLNITVEGPLSLFMMIKDNYTGNWQFIPNNQSLFPVGPQVEKIQADTNIALQKQSNENERSNNNVEGLTYIIIGLVPFGLGCEILIHRYLTSRD